MAILHCIVFIYFQIHLFAFSDLATCPGCAVWKRYASIDDREVVSDLGTTVRVALFPLSARGRHSPPKPKTSFKKTRGPNRTTKCASWCEAPPPGSHALARFARLPVALCSSPAAAAAAAVVGCVDDLFLGLRLPAQQA